MTIGKVYRPKIVTSAMVQAKPQAIFVFGDNMARAGYGGQAAAMRGKPNCVGIPTKWTPRRDAGAFFDDDVLRNPSVREAIFGGFRKLKDAIGEGRDIYIPADGLGTGLAELPRRAPYVFGIISAEIAELERLAGGRQQEVPFP